MAQKTNLNVSPYYDDFDKNNNFYRVLFRPGFPVQARELTTLQSILQNQIESFGKNLYKEGEKVIPGNFALSNQYFSVKINSTHLGINLSQYIDLLIGKTVKGQTSGVVAKIFNYLNISESDGITHLTLFVEYIESGNDNVTTFFVDGETLQVQEAFNYGSVVVSAGETIATLIEDNSCSIGSSFSIEEGVYFIRGSFVNVAEDTIVLDAYTNKPSYRIGLTITEEITNSRDDSSLFDNAKGFSNFAAPGADRLKITTKLSKKSLDDFNDESFIELFRVINGKEYQISKPDLDTKLDDKLAKRTYEESGHYSVKDFEIEIKETLDDEIGNQGIYTEKETTESGNTPTDNLMSVKFSPGIAYVSGYRVEKEETTILDVEKPRDTGKKDNSLMSFDFGTLVKVNNVTGTPNIGIGFGSTIVSLLDRRLTNDTVGAATTIGEAKVYSFSLDGNSYIDDSTDWNLYLYDVNIFTNLTINTELTAPATSYIRGKSSNASGYLKTAITNATELSLTQVSGTFIVGEQLIINETEENSRTVVSFTKYNQQDVKSVFSPLVGSGTTFLADTTLKNQQIKNIGNINVTISAQSGSASTITSTVPAAFFGVKTGDIIKYNIAGNTLPTLNLVTGVGTGNTTLTLAAVSNVTNVCLGELPASEFNGPITLAVSEFKSNGGLYAKLPNNNISTVNLNNSQLSITGQLTGLTPTSGEVTLTSANISTLGITSALYKSYSPEKYSFFNNDLVATDPGFVLTDGGSSASITGLSNGNTIFGSDTIANISLLKTGISSKKKIYTRSQFRNVIFSNTAIGAAENGLTQNNFYGLRVQDKEISLNVPDVSKILAIYESLDNNLPVLDLLTVPNSASLDTSAILGEKIKGQDSGAIAQVVEIQNGADVRVVLLNNKSFIQGENISFDESNINTIVVLFTKGNYQDVTQKYTLDNGGRSEYYDYSRIIKIDDSYTPSHRLSIVFDCYTVLESDSGDVYTVNSYDAERFKDDIPTIDGVIRSSDTLDFRPRVVEFTATNSSPFAPANRNFSSGSSSNPTLVITPKEDSILGYEYYLPRIDKIVLQKNGQLNVLKGTSSLLPIEQKISEKDDLMLLATLELPAYLYNVNDVKITIKDNKRYTMRDIGEIDSRLTNLESTTELSVLELLTKIIQVKDFNGFDKFKTGFFVDAFTNGEKIDLKQSKTKCQVDILNKELEAFTEVETIKPILATNDTTTDTTLTDLSDVFPDGNIVKKGNSILLKYDEVESEIKNPYVSKFIQLSPFVGIDGYFDGIMTLTPSIDIFKNIKTSKSKFVSKSGGKSEDWSNQKIIDSSNLSYMRSRNVKFEVDHLISFAKYFAKFDGQDIDIIPKLLVIEMTSGTFIPGATVIVVDANNKEILRTRICTPNHKNGPIDNPTKKYTLNPYDKDASIPEAYEATSTILNIDIDGLTESAQDEFYGYIESGATVIMIGQDTTATATIQTTDLVSDQSGNLIGSFFLKKPEENTKNKLFTSGTKTFKLKADKPFVINTAETSPGTVESLYTSTSSIEISKSTTINNIFKNFNPFAQTFKVNGDSDIVCTSVDIWFYSQPTATPIAPDPTFTVTLAIVEVGNDLKPSQKLVNFDSKVTKDSSEINSSATFDNTKNTNFKFKTPVPLKSGKEYAIVLFTPKSKSYGVWISEVGNKDLGGSTTQTATGTSDNLTGYTSGSLYQSSNGGNWVENINSDLTFTLKKAKFVTNPGTAYFYNNISDVSDYYALDKDSIQTLPRKISVGIGTTTVLSGILTIGTKVSDGTNTTDPYGFIEKVGSGVSSITITNPGIGYSAGTYNNVTLYNIQSSGSGAVGNITVGAAGTITNISITAGIGSGYVVGDTLGITTSQVTKGKYAQLTVSEINGIDTLYLTNVQGQNFATATPLVYYNNLNIPISLGSTNITSSTPSTDSRYDGNTLRVSQVNHGLHGDGQVISLSGIEPNTSPTTLSTEINESVQTISVASTVGFSTFEGSALGINGGYLKIGTEIMRYTAIGSGTLTVTRGVNPTPHSANSKVYKYELNGISLTRINTDEGNAVTHSGTGVTSGIAANFTDIDDYFLKINRGTASSFLGGTLPAIDTDDSMRSFSNENSVGGDSIKATKNIQFSAIEPNIVISGISNESSVTSQIRTVSGRSVNGSESPFIDQGYENIDHNTINYLDNVRTIASRPNELNSITISALPQQKSFTYALTLSNAYTNENGDTVYNENISPCIDYPSMSISLHRNRLNRPIVDYITDSRVNLVSGDPHAYIYVTQKISIEQPATSIKVLIDANRDSTADFRVLYQLFKVESSNNIETYELFPGYENLKDTNLDGFGDQVIDVNKNNGKADKFVSPSVDGEFYEYQFTADNLDKFNGFRIKIVASGTNEAKPPVFKNLKVIALA